MRYIKYSISRIELNFMMLKGLHDLEIGHFVVLYVYLALQLNYKSTGRNAVLYSCRKGMGLLLQGHRS